MKYKVKLISKRDSHEKEIVLHADTKKEAEYDAEYLGNGNWQVKSSKEIS